MYRKIHKKVDQKLPKTSIFKSTLFTDTNIIATAEMDIVTRKNEENRKLSESNLNHVDNKLSELQKFYDGKNVFVTGGTGKNNHSKI